MITKTQRVGISCSYKCDVCGKEFDAKHKALNHHVCEHLQPTIPVKVVTLTGASFKVCYFESEEQVELYSRFILYNCMYDWNGPGWYMYKPGTREGYTACVSYLPNIIDEIRDQARELTEHADALQKILDEK